MCHPQLYEINTYPFLTELSGEPQQPLNLRDIPQPFWKTLQAQGFTHVWMMGMWQRSPASRATALRVPELRDAYTRALGDWADTDVHGSPYAVLAYRPDPRFGDWDDLESLRHNLHQVGLKLILDFVPNHTAIDHAWATENPDWLVQGAPEQAVQHPGLFHETADGSWLAHGKDPNFPAWTDTLQIDHASPAAREALTSLLLNLARYCDGLRCDMAMLAINRVFAETWRPIRGDAPMPEGEFWPQAIRATKGTFPEFVFIAEAYWGLELELQQQGFDFTYDKKFYDRLVNGTADDVRGHLSAGAGSQNSAVRFIENHDEPRALSIMSPERARAAAMITLSVPGMAFVHHGQTTGQRHRLPVQLGRDRIRPPDGTTQEFYARLFALTRDPALRAGAFRLIDVRPAGEANPSYRHILAWSWTQGAHTTIVVINFSANDAQARLILPTFRGRTRTVTFSDRYNDDTYVRPRDELEREGLYVDLPGWQSHWLVEE